MTLAFFSLDVNAWFSSLLQQPLFRPLHQQQISRTASKLKSPLQFGVLGIIIDAGIERLGLSGLFQELSQLPTLKDVFDLCHEGWNFSPEVRVVVSGFKEIDELLADQISQGPAGPKLVFDAEGGLTLFGPDLV